jgi:glycosyltransferase involved in cell wall biosynthesis
MKICIFTETYYPVVGGGETQARLLADGLVACGHSVIIFTRKSGPEMKRNECYGDVSIYRLSPAGSGQLKKWGLLFSSIPMLIQLADRYDLIFVSGYRIIGITAVIVGKLLRKKIVLKADSQGEMSGEFFISGLNKFGMASTSPWFKLFLRFRNYILKKADSFSAISSEIASEWIESGVPSSRIHIIPNCVDTSRFLPVKTAQKSELRIKLRLPQDVMIATYTGRLVSYKGLPLLLKVWNVLRTKHENVLLVLLGTGGLDIHNCENELREFVNVNNMSHHVLFTGDVQNVEEYLQASDFFVFPSENDAFPSSLVEAMACGLPVVTTPVGAIKAIVTDRENGFLVQPGNYEQLLNALDNMVSTDGLLPLLGQAARKSIQDSYSAEIVLKKYLDLFTMLLSGPGVPHRR